MRVKADGSGELEKFDDVDAPLSALDERDMRLWPLEALAELCLREARLLSLLNDIGDQRQMTDRTERAGQRAPPESEAP